MLRKIGSYQGTKRGPMLVAFGGVHGNEPAGVAALKQLFQMLEAEPHVNPGFEFKGNFVGITGNCGALMAHKRYIDKDLNRAWTFDMVESIRTTPKSDLTHENLEIYEILNLLQREITAYQPEELVFLDLHTTSASGGIFSIPADEAAALQLSRALFAPAILGIMQRVEGALLYFAQSGGFCGNFRPASIRALAFESGQHDDPLSVQRAISATIDCLRAVGCIKKEDVDGKHDAILKQYSQNLPKVVRLKYAHAIKPGDTFQMRRGYTNFQPISAGEHLADDTNGPILAPHTGFILMPLYQKLGTEGFFVVEEVSDSE